MEQPKKRPIKNKKKTPIVDNMKLECKPEQDKSITTFPCTLCDSVLKLRGSWLRHMKKHYARAKDKDKPKQPVENVQPNQFECDICHAKLKSKDYIRHHMKQHINAQPYSCDQCPKKFNVKWLLTRHLRAHSTLRPYQCDQCGKDFKNSDSIRIHLRTHNNQERAYKCTLCPCSYTDPTSLKYHQRVHTGERPYICDFCGTGFRALATLKVHRRLHTGENPFICHICGKTAKQCSTIKSHYQRFHKIPDMTLKVIKINSKILSKYTAEELKQNDLVALLNMELAKRKLEPAPVAATAYPPYQVVNYGALAAAAANLDTNETKESCKKHIKMASNFSTLDWKSSNDDDLQSGKETGILETKSALTNETVKIEDSNIFSPAPIYVEQILVKAEPFDDNETDPIKQEYNDDDHEIKSNVIIQNVLKIEELELPIPDSFVECDLNISAEENNEYFDDENDRASSIDVEIKVEKTEKEEESQKLTVKQKISYDPKLYPFACNICPKRFRRKSSLIEHFAAHKGERNFTCNICEAKFLSRTTLRRHMISHGVGRPFECDYCGKAFKSKYILRIHFKTHLDTKPYKCQLCDSSFTRSWGLTSHMQSHSGTMESEIFTKCTVCCRRYKNIERHMQTHNEKKKDTKTKWSICTICNGRYEPTNYIKHMMKHDRTLYPFECNICDKKFRRKTSLNEHFLAHKDERNFICDICGAKFLGQITLRRHMVSHSDERPFECDYCGKSFKSKYILGIHFKSHFGSKSFQCKICNTLFTRAFGLKAHMLRHSRTFKCKTCGMTFMEKSTCTEHFKTHMPYKCEICGKRVQTARILKAHMKNVHKQQIVVSSTTIMVNGHTKDC